MKINIETIPHEKQRYTTVGDWEWGVEWDRPPGTDMGPKELWKPVDALTIRVSKLSDWRLEFLIGVHELIEAMLCKQAGITTTQVDAFDKAFGDRDEEPGDDSQAPYRKQHCIATGIERLLAAELGVDWKAYEQELFDLPDVPNKL